MKWYIVLTLTAVFLLFTVAEPVLAEMYGGQQYGGQQMMGGKGKASEMMNKGKSMREQQGMHGMGFMHSAGNAYGEYVTFTIDSQTGNVLNYGVNGTPLFNFSVANFNYKSTSEMGSVTRVANTDGSIMIQIHDNPAAVINILTNKAISVAFTLADGVTAAKEDNFVRIESGSIIGYIVGGNITSSVNGKQVNVDASPNSAVVFRTAPVNMPMFDHMYRRFSQEIARNRMGMEIALGRNGTYSSVNYSARMQMRVQSMERDRIRMLLDATEPAGRIIAINLDNTSLVIGARDRLRIHYDGKPMQCVDDPNVVFNGTDRPLCWISPAQEGIGWQLMMYVPNFSEHTVDIVVEPEVTGTPTATLTANLTASPTITTVKPAETPKTAGFGIMVALAGLLAWAFLARRRNK